MGRYSVHTLSWIQSFPECPTNHWTAKLRAGDREPFKSARPQWIHRKTPRISRLLPYWQDCLEALIGQRVLALLMLKCASGLGRYLFQISGVVCTSFTFEQVFQEESHPQPKSSERTHHSSSGYSAASFSPLWAMILHLPGPYLNFILPLIKVNSLHSPFLRCSRGINLTNNYKDVQASLTLNRDYRKQYFCFVASCWPKLNCSLISKDDNSFIFKFPWADSHYWTRRTTICETFF